MKIAFVGKGGSGKTTLSSLFIRHLAARNAPVVAVDADINQHLGVALGLDEEAAGALPAMGAQLPLIKEYLRGSNPRITSSDTMIKTTPPGEGSRLLRVREDNPVYAACARTVRPDGGQPGGRATDGGTDSGERNGGGCGNGDIRLMATGPFTESDLGVACYHSKVGAVELCLNHLVDGRDEYVVVDMTAGSDSFASGMFTRFDMTFLVAEPTRKGVSVYRQYTEYARDFGVTLKVVGNKVQGQDDLDFLRAEVGEDLLVTVGHSDWVRALEKGRPLPFSSLEAENRRALETLWRAADDSYTRRDWERYTRQMVHFHLKNAESWGNAKTGADLAAQVDPGFVLGEQSAGVSAPLPA
ncbi:ATP-binding protein [Streptomyces clavuligerus]|uniref:Carbon monoxide dehydrogenase accessory protein n=1 Tax=Streptomyces clavuligerus TaxID=1901 RepID=B5GXZ2_STRCL|nr:ATP-binding protein [Streptomyces clavuligerus]ANW19564.1 ATP-binding protein [Streptomyces clavuligerus]AXU14171.1 ATP-binding protein [Streptomyces clavuligerus]EDY51188.1 carbon monoxide dehydrogenase accessory protein [Streptomyces clavuligerus]EFG07624.1 Carbon monoxide dehydrogenase accessory protein [Streptomyces clavuligerus]MBY6304166.1 ATP-binding protein [Streptomyces clavuligerus]